MFCSSVHLSVIIWGLMRVCLVILRHAGGNKKASEPEEWVGTMGGNRTGAYMLSRETEVDVISVSSVTSGSCRVTQDVRYASLCFRIYSFISLFLLDVSSEVRLFDAT